MYVVFFFSSPSLWFHCSFNHRLHYTHNFIERKKLIKTIASKVKNRTFEIVGLWSSSSSSSMRRSLAQLFWPKRCVLFPSSFQRCGFFLSLCFELSLITSNVYKLRQTLIKCGCEFTGTWTYAIWLNMSKRWKWTQRRKRRKKKLLLEMK